MFGGRRGWPEDTRSPLTSPASGSWTLLQPSSQRVGSSVPGRATPDPESPQALPGPCPQSPARGLLQVFEEEHHILYLDHGGVIVAIKDTSIPLKILK